MLVEYLWMIHLSLLVVCVSISQARTCVCHQYNKDKTTRTMLAQNSLSKYTIAQCINKTLTMAMSRMKGKYKRTNIDWNSPPSRRFAHSFFWQSSTLSRYLLLATLLIADYNRRVLQLHTKHNANTCRVRSTGAILSRGTE